MTFESHGLFFAHKSESIFYPDSKLYEHRAGVFTERVRGIGIVQALEAYPVNYGNFRLGEIFDKEITKKARRCRVRTLIEQLIGCVQSRPSPNDFSSYCLLLEDISEG